MTTLNREQRAELHYQQRNQWLRVTFRKEGTFAFGIASLSEPNHFYVCDGLGCTCPDYRFHGLSSVRIGQGGSHQPCSHMLAVQRVLDVSPLIQGVLGAISDGHG